MKALFLNKDFVPLGLLPLSDWDICHGMGETCDWFEVSAPFEKELLPKLERYYYFQGLDDEGNVIFYGIVDEYTVTCDEDGARVTVSGRGLGALLFDNEAEAASYASLGLDTLIANHVKPYGLGKFEMRSMPRLNNFSVSSGESEWSVVSRFCRYSCGVQPRFSKTGVLLFRDVPGEVRKFDGSSVFSLKRRDCRYGIISSVLVKNRVTGARYTIHNEDFEARKGRARRVITVPKATGADAVRYTAEYQIRESERGKNTIELGVCAQFAGFAGDYAELSLPEAGITGRYRIIKSRCFAEESGGGTMLTLEV